MNNRTITLMAKVLNQIVEKLADILIPKEKKVKLLESLGPDGLFQNIPRAENFDLRAQAGFDITKIKAMFNYKTILCRQAIWEIKYRANQKLIRDFSLLLYEYLLEELTDLKTFSNFSNPILIPIPSSATRTREKGFNQCVLIVQELIKIDRERNGDNFTSLENYLIKKNDTAHQARVSNRKKRLENLKGAFSTNESVWPGLGKLSERLGTPLSGESYFQAGPMPSFIIIDDVITTGATMAEAFRALKTAGIPTAKIRGYALAH